MKTDILKEGVELQAEIKMRESLVEHFETTRITDPIKEVTELLTGYDNLMSGFSRKEVAELMIARFSDYNKEVLDELRNDFEKL